VITTPGKLSAVPTVGSAAVPIVGGESLLLWHAANASARQVERHHENPRAGLRTGDDKDLADMTDFLSERPSK